MKSLFLDDELEIFRELESRHLATGSLYEFVQQAWPVIEGKTPFIGGWHIEAICEHLEAVVRGEIKKLIISVPPRTGKTNVISVMWPAWVWIKRPNTKFLFSSYAIKISWEHSRLCRLLIESPWFQQRWGHIVSLSNDQATKGHFTNSALGHRIATSVGAGGTALGGDILVMDDPNEAGESQITRESTNDWVSRVWTTRLNPSGIGASILVQQRTHDMDVSGYLMSLDENKEYVKLILPMEFESERRAKTIVLPSTKKKIWQDPRTKEGQLLCPLYLNAKEVERKKIGLGTYNYASQYQQRPSPAEGGIFKKSYFNWWKHPKPPKILQTIQSWDTALEAKKSNCYSACTTWGYFLDVHKVPCIILLSLWRGRVEYPELRTLVKNLYEDYRNDGTIDITPDGRHGVDMLLIEAKASGATLIQDLRRTGVNAVGFNPTPYGDKDQRAKISSAYVESKQVWVAAMPPNYTQLRPMSNTLVELASVFPNADSRDVVDTMSQAIIKLSQNGYFVNRKDPKFDYEEDKPSHAFYDDYEI